ncbi:MAG: SCO family protein [Sphingomonadales bacterium]|nr:SCO family protein [Sphingomonadales bacterium]
MGSREQYFQAVDREEPPSFSLIDAEGRAVALSDFKGKVVVLHFIYASCPDVCPLHADRIAEIQGLINASPTKDQVRFVSITTDPKNDSAEVMRGYGPVHGLDSVNWSFLTIPVGQPEDTTRELATAYGHTFAKTEGHYQVHGVVTHVIDRRGRWRANFHGLRFAPVNLVLYVNGLVNETPRPTPPQAKGWWDKLRKLF